MQHRKTMNYLFTLAYTECEDSWLLMPFLDIHFDCECNYDSSFVSGGIDEVMEPAWSCPCGLLLACHITTAFKILDKKTVRS